MQRNVGLVANHPGVVTGRNVEHLPRAHFNHIAIAHRGGRAAGNNHTDMLDKAFFLSQRLANVFGPAPSRLVRGAANGHAADVDNFEFSFFKGAGIQTVSE